MLLQVLQAKTKVANGKVFDLAVKLSQGDMPDQIMQVRTEAFQAATCLQSLCSDAVGQFQQRY